MSFLKYMTLDETNIMLDKYGLSTGYFLSINAVVGAGFLAIPFVFANSGWLMSLVFMIYIALQSYYLAHELLEIMSRCEIVIRYEENSKELIRPSLKQILTGVKDNPLMENSRHHVHIPSITHRRLDISENVRMIFGDKIGKAYAIILICFMQGALTSYATIFASSFASNVPIGTLEKCDIYETSSYSDDCFKNYWIYLVVYAIFMCYLSLKGLKEQKWLQSILTIMRFVIIFMILFGAI